MLGEHGIGSEFAIIVQAAVRNDALPLTKQVGQYAAVDNREFVFQICQRELDVEFPGLANNTSFDDESANAKVAIVRIITFDDV